MLHTCVVDKNIDFKVAHRQRVSVGQVHRPHVAADLVGQRTCTLLVPICDRHARALRGEIPCDGCADSTCTTGHQSRSLGVR